MRPFSAAVDFTRHSVHISSLLRKMASGLRHAPGFQHLTPLWTLLRPHYQKSLTQLSGRRGIPIKVGGHSMRIDPSLVHLDWEHVEEHAYRVYQQAIQPSAIIYDIGAHIGTYSYIGAKTGGANSRIVAYEPCALTRFFLTQHLQWNEVAEQVEIRACACGSQSGRYAFFVHPDEPDGRNSLIQSEGFDEHQVEVTTLDQEVNKLQLAPDLIKIDVEGFEFEVLKGAQHVLHEYSPNLLLSLHPVLLHKLGSSAELILNWLAIRGYTITKISQDHEIHIFATPSTRRLYS